MAAAAAAVAGAAVAAAAGAGRGQARRGYPWSMTRDASGPWRKLRHGGANSRLKDTRIFQTPTVTKCCANHSVTWSKVRHNKPLAEVSRAR